MGLTLIDGQYQWLDDEELQQRGIQAETMPKRKQESFSPSSLLPNNALAADRDDNILVGAAKTPLRMAYNAGVEILQEGSDVIRDVSEWTGIAPEGTATTGTEEDKPILGLGNWKPVRADNEQAYLTGVENFGTGVAQFVGEWFLLSKALRGINWGLKTSKIPSLAKIGKVGSKISTAEKAVQTTVATESAKALAPYMGTKAAAFTGRRLLGPGVGAAYNATVNPKGMAIDFAGFDQWEGRLVDLADNSEWFSWVANLPLANQLTSDPDDTAIEGRFKNIVEGWAIDFGLSGPLKAIDSLPIDRANLVVDATKARGYALQLREAIAQYGSKSEEVNVIKEKIVKHGEKLEENPIVQQMEPDPWEETSITTQPVRQTDIQPAKPLDQKLLTQADEQLEARRTANETRKRSDLNAKDEAAFNRIINAMDKALGHEWKGGIDTAGDIVNVLNVARVTLEEGVQKALRDFWSITTSPSGRRKNITEQIPGVKGFLKRARTLRRIEEAIDIPAQSVVEEVPTTPKELPPPDAKKVFEAKQTKALLDETNAELNALGPQPPKPPKGQMKQANGKWTPEYKTYMADWRKRSPLLKKLEGLEKKTEPPTLEVKSDDQPKAQAVEVKPRAETLISEGDFEDKIRPPKQPFKTNLESGRGLKGSQGADYIEKRLRGSTLPSQMGSKKEFGDQWEGIFTERVEDRDAIMQFMDTIGRSMFDDVSLSITSKLTPRGRFNYANNLLQIKQNVVRTGELQLVMVHELWHSLSRYLPKKELKRLVKEFNTEKAKWLKTLTDDELKQFNRGAYTEDTYRYSDIDEYFVETMLDEWWTYADELDDPIKRGSLRAVGHALKMFFNNILWSVQAQLGLGNTKKIFNDFINGRYKKLARRTNLEFSSLDIDPYVPVGAADLPQFKEGDTGESINAKISRRFLEDLKKVENGQMRTEDLYKQQDILNIISSGKFKTQYVPRDTPSEVLYRAVASVTDRITSTGMPNLKNQIVLDDILTSLRKTGMNFSEVEMASKGIKDMAQNTEADIMVLHNLRIATVLRGKEAGVKAANVMNAIRSGEINWNKAVTEMEVATVDAIKTFRTYQRVTRSLGQRLQSLQGKIDTVDGISVTLEPMGLLKEIDEKTAAAAGDVTNPDNISLGKIFGEEVQEALVTGKWGPGTKLRIKEIAKKISDEGLETGLGIGNIEKIMTGPNLETAASTIETRTGTTTAQGKPKELSTGDKVELFGRTLATSTVNGILSAAKTWTVQTSVPLLRAYATPALDLYQRTLTVPKGGIIPINPSAFIQRLPITASWYMHLVTESWGALQLASKAFRDGQLYFDAYRNAGSFDINTQKFIGDSLAATERGQAVRLPSKKGAYNLNELEFTKALGLNNSQQALANALWKFNTFDIRSQVAIETYQKALVGNSYLHVIGLEEGLQQAAREGLASDEAMRFAENYAAEKVKYFTHDAIVDGKHITDAINTHPAALKMGRMMTFTDDIRAKMEHRTFAHGQELAVQSGIDPKNYDEINDFALKYKTGKFDERMGWRYNAVNNPASKFFRSGDTTLPMGGEETPFLTGGWSAIPSMWSGLQRKRWGWLATLTQPFVRSPSDIMKQTVRMLPGFNLTVDSFYRDVFDEDAFFSNSWKTEMTMGLAVIPALVGFMNNDDWQWTGAGPLSHEARGLWEARGMRPMSFRRKYIDEDGIQKWTEWESYRAYEPISSIIRMVADYKDLAASVSWQDREYHAGVMAFDLAGSVMAGTLESTYYAGIAELLNLLPSGFGQSAPRPGEIGKVERFAFKKALSMFPHSSRVRELTQAIDPYKRVNLGDPRTKTVDPQVGYGKPGFEWEDPTTGNTYPYTESGGGLFGLTRAFVNEIKKNTPFWSETLPIKRNHVTGDPLWNPGFLHDDDLGGLQDEPWLSRLTSGFFLTHLPIAYSFIPVVGALPQVVGRTGQEETISLEDSQGRKDHVVAELMRLRGFGSSFPAPSAGDVQKNVTLSAPAYDQYLKYLTMTGHPDYQDGTLWQALFNVMNSENYLNQPPDVELSEGEETPRTKLILPVWRAYLTRAKWLFKNDPTNEHVLEVLQEDRRQTISDIDTGSHLLFNVPKKEAIKKVGSTKRVSATEYIQSVQ